MEEWTIIVTAHVYMTVIWLKNILKELTETFFFYYL